MAKFVVLFEDDDDFAQQRAEFMEEHLGFLEDHASSIKAAGPLTNSENGVGAGGIWLVDADHSEDVADLVERDPFWPTGLRKSFKILSWKQVFCAGQRQPVP